MKSAALLTKFIDCPHPAFPMLHQWVAMSIGHRIDDQYLVLMGDQLMVLIDS
jgi:hypothetical protein